MKITDRKAKMFLAMSEIYEKKYSELAMEMYFESVDEMTDADFELILKNIRKKAKWFPKPAEMNEEYRLMRAGRPASLQIERPKQPLIHALEHQKIAYDALSDADKEKMRQYYLTAEKNNLLRSRAKRMSFEKLGNCLSFLQCLKKDKTNA